MKIRKYLSFPSFSLFPTHLMDLIDDMAYPFETTNYTFHGQFVDTDRYEIRPKESYKKELIEKKKGEAERLQKQIDELNKEIKELDGS